MKKSDYKYVFKLRDGSTVEAHRENAKRTVDIRVEGSPMAETVWEIRTPSGLYRRIWADEISTWDQVEA